jgi:WD40 repeat protein
VKGKCDRKFFGHDNAINSVASNEYFNVLASASSDATVKLWDMESGSRVALETLNGFKDSVSCVEITND